MIVGAILFVAKRNADASYWDNAIDYHNTYGDQAVFIDNGQGDGTIYFGSSARLSSAGTKFETVGWQIQVRNSSGAVIDNIYAQLGGDIIRLIKDTDYTGYNYQLYGLTLHTLKRSMNTTARSALSSANCSIVFNAGNVKKVNGVKQGWMSDGNPGSGVYYTYDGIAGAAGWSSTTMNLLHNFYGIQLQGLFRYITVANGGNGCSGANGSGWYCYGAAVSATSTYYSGYTVDGWYENGNKVSGSASYSRTVLGNTTITAYGKGNPYTITYNINGSTDTYSHAPSGCPSAQTYTYGGGSVTLSGTTPTWYGRKCLGWSKSSTATSATWGIGASFSKVVGNTTLYAVWQKTTFPQTNNFYKEKNGVFEKFAETSHNITYTNYYTCTNEGVTTPTGYWWGGFAKSGWTVTGDKNDKDGWGFYYPIKYAIHFDANGGSGALDDIQNVKYDVSQQLPQNATINGKIWRKGYKFSGWSLTPTGNVYVGDMGTVINLSSTNGAVVSLYAVWEPIHYDVQYDGNGSTAGSVAPQKYVPYDNHERNCAAVNYTYQANGFINQTNSVKYDFVGWKQVTLDDGDSAKATVKPGASFSNLSAIDRSIGKGNQIHMQAQWVQDTRDYTVTVVVNGGSVVYNGTTYTSNFNVVGKYGTVFDLALNSPKNSSGQYFKKWVINNTRELSLMDLPDLPARFQIMGDGTVTASWDTTYTVTVNPNGGVVNGKTSSFTIQGKKGDIFVLDFSFCDYPMTSVTYNTSNCITAKYGYQKASNYATTFGYDESSGYFTNTTTGMTPKSGYKIGYASYTINSSGTVTVNWNKPATVNIWNITLNDNGGTGGQGNIYEKAGYGFYSDSTASVKISKLDKIPMNITVNSEFLGYYNTSASSGGTQVIDADGNIKVANTFFTSNTTVYARWKVLPIPDTEYTIQHFYSNVDATTGVESYSPTPSATTYGVGRVGDVITLRNLAKTDSSAKGFVYSTAYVDGSTATSATLKKDMVIKIFYIRDYFKVDLVAGNGIKTVGKTGTCTKTVNGVVYYKFGTKVTLSATAETGYTFSNWECTAGGVSSSTTVGYSFVMPNDAVAFEAHSNDGKYIITYDNNGGEVKNANPTSYTVNTTTFSLNPATKDYCRFMGWTGTNGTTPGSVTISKGSTGNRTYKANFDWSVYTLTLDRQGGTGGSSEYYEKYNTGYYSGYNSTSYAVSTVITSITKPTRTGYTFMGYYDKPMGSSGADAVILIDANGAIKTSNTYFTKNATVYAWWGNIVSEVTLDQQGATETGTLSYYARYADKYYQDSTCNAGMTTIIQPTRVGYTFGGYYTGTKGSGTQYVNASGTITNSLSLASNITVYANWIAKPCTITYNYNKPNNSTNAMTGNTSDSKVVNYDAAYGTLPSPAIVGWTFNGWYTDANYTTKVTTATVCKGDAIIYAKWTANPYTVKFNTNKPSNASSSVTGSMPNISAVYDRVGNLPENTYALIGWTFVRWNTKADGSGVSVEPDDSIWNLAPSGEVTLYAQWSVNKYNIAFNSNKPSTSTSTITGTMSTITNRNYDTSYTLTANAFKQVGYTFDGWSLTPTGNRKYDDKATVKNLSTTDGDTVTLYARWTANSDTKYVVRHWQQNISGNKDVHDSTNYTCVTADTQNFTGTSDTFVTPSVNTYIGFNSPEAQKVRIKPDGSLVVDYYYTRIVYTVTFDYNVPSNALSTLSGNSTTSKTVLYGDKFGTLPSPSLTGWTFKGWYTSKTGGINILASTVYNYTADITLYAHWKDEAKPIITDISVNPPTTSSSIEYGWQNEDKTLSFKATDSGSGLSLLAIYKGTNTSGEALANTFVSGNLSATVDYKVTEEGISDYTVVAKDRGGNTSMVHVIVKIDKHAPTVPSTDSVTAVYDGYNLNVNISDIIEELPGNTASGCKEAWVVLKGYDDVGELQSTSSHMNLNLLTSTNIYTGAKYGKTLNSTALGEFNYYDKMTVDIYIKDIAGNENLLSSPTFQPFHINAIAEKSAGNAVFGENWKSGAGGWVRSDVSSFVDKLEITYPTEWQGIAEEADNITGVHSFDFALDKEMTKHVDDNFFVPMNTDNGTYYITVKAYKGSRTKTAKITAIVDGSIKDSIKTRFRFKIR